MVTSWSVDTPWKPATTGTLPCGERLAEAVGPDLEDLGPPWRVGDDPGLAAGEATPPARRGRRGPCTAAPCLALAGGEQHVHLAAGRVVGHLAGQADAGRRSPCPWRSRPRRPRCRGACVRATWSATARMRSGSATDVPPNFWTTSATTIARLPATVDHAVPTCKASTPARGRRQPASGRIAGGPAAPAGKRNGGAIAGGAWSPRPGGRRRCSCPSRRRRQEDARVVSRLEHHRGRLDRHGRRAGDAARARRRHAVPEGRQVSSTATTDVREGAADVHRRHQDLHGDDDDRRRRRSPSTLDAKKAPKTVNNFVVLARYHYFDGITFHRVIPDFVDPGRRPHGTGTGGPGYKFEDELPQAGEYKVGSLAMANSGAEHQRQPVLHHHRPAGRRPAAQLLAVRAGHRGPRRRQADRGRRRRRHPDGNPRRSSPHHHPSPSRSR